MPWQAATDQPRTPICWRWPGASMGTSGRRIATLPAPASRHGRRPISCAGWRRRAIQRDRLPILGRSRWWWRGRRTVGDSSGGFWVGADPGGANAFGLAILLSSGEIQTKCVSCADQAVDLIPSRPFGVGIDAPLWWSSGRSADREADRWIRRTYHIAAGTVQAANSLRGAALVQGIMFASRLREKYPGVPITESHPKAVAMALGGWESAAVAKLGIVSANDDHTRDATMAAWAAREGF